MGAPSPYVATRTALSGRAFTVRDELEPRAERLHAHSDALTFNQRLPPSGRCHLIELGEAY